MVHLSSYYINHLIQIDGLLLDYLLPDLPCMLDQVFYHTLKRLAIANLLVCPLLPILKHLLHCPLHGF